MAQRRVEPERTACRVLAWFPNRALGDRIARVLARSSLYRCEIQQASRADEGRAAIAAGGVDVVMLDAAKGGGARERLRSLRGSHPTLPVLVVTPPGTHRAGLSAVGQGAADLLRTELLDPFSVTRALSVALRRGERERERDMEAAGSARSSFLARMSHEIRTPIHAIIGNTELLEGTRLDDEQREYAATVRASADALLGLVNDVLDMSRIEAGRLELERKDFDLAAVIEAAASLNALEANRKGLELVVHLAPDLPEAVRGDPGRLRQVIVNLLSNAVKFTHGGEIVVSVTHAATTETLEVSVRDTGIGIAADKLPLLFQSFSQLGASTSRQFGGSGLGLAISRSLVELMGGAIGVESREGAGSRFWFTVPLERSSAPQERPSPRVALTGLRTLIVDDNASARAALLDCLRSWGCDVVEAADGRAALELLRSRCVGPSAVRVALVDLKLPGMDGWQLAREVSADTTINGTRLLLLSPVGSGAGEPKMKLLRWFDAYLTKPFRKHQLAEAMVAVAGNDIDLEPVAEEESSDELLPPGEWRVLVAEDDPVSRALYATVLRAAGYSVVIAADGEEAVDTARSAIATGGGRPAFDIVILDVNMPRLDGPGAARRLREMGLTAPIVAATADSRVEERERCLGSGMNDFLPKPFRKRDLGGMLRRWLVDYGPAGTRPGFGSAAAATQRGADPTAVLDLQAAVKDFLGNEATVRKLLDGFLDSTANRLPVIGAAVRRDDREKVRFEAHAVRGAAMNLHAGRMAEAARALERAAAEGALEGADLLLAGLSQALDELRAAGRRAD